MSYVPTPIFTGTPERPSIRARELSDRMRDLISRFRQEHPDLSDQDVLQALGLTRSSLVGAGAERSVVVTAFALGLLVLGLVGYFAARGELAGDLPVPMIAVAVLLGAAGVLALILKPRR